MEKKQTKLQWHPAFCAATELELKEDRDKLEFLSEYPLSKQPLKIDLMVIKKKPEVKIKNEIGHLFMTHNIFEYKSPDDDLNIDDYYKSLAYVYMYKSQSNHVNEIPYNELTLTLIYDSYPAKLFNILKESGHIIEKKYEGIYYLKGNPSLPYQQIIVTSDFGKNHCPLKALSKNFSVEDGIELIELIEKTNSKYEKSNLDAILQVSFIANNDIFIKLRKENHTMCEAFFELFKDEVAAKIAAAEDVVRKETEALVRKETEALVRKETEAKVKALENEIEQLKKRLNS